VEVAENVSRVRVPAGTFELEPRDGLLAVRAWAADDARLRRLQEMVGAHLTRFARDGAPALEWASVEARVEARVRGHRNGRHAVRARDWVVRLEADAREALRVSALLHDVDREEGGVPLPAQIAAWDDPRMTKEHAERSARLAAERVREAGGDAALARDAEELVRLHEVGGTREADILQAADSLSFLEVTPTARWIAAGLSTRDAAERKLRWMHERIRHSEARALGAPLLAAALDDLGPGVEHHANEGRDDGNTR
jgi:hypothetical protein